jgi:hypothetical protein
MSARRPRRGPHRQAAARHAGPRPCRLAAVLAALTCALLASAAVPAAVATTLPDGGPLAAGVPAAAPAQQPDQPGRPATASPCSEVCPGGGYASGTSTATAPAHGLPLILLGAGAPGPCSEVCSGGGYGPGAGTPGPCSEVCSGGGYGLAGPASRTPGGPRAGHTARTLPPGRAVTGSAGFHWGDAAIGAGGMLAAIVLGIGGALTLIRRNHRIHDLCSTLIGRLWAAQPAGARGAAGPSRPPGEGGRAPGTDVPPGADLITF